MNVKKYGELVLPLAAIEEVEPIHTGLSDLFLKPRLVVIETDGEDLETLLPVLLIGLFQMGKLGDAGATPGGPEIDQDHLAGEAGRGHGLAAPVILHLEALQLAANDPELLKNRLQPGQHPALARGRHRFLHIVHEATSLFDPARAGEGRGELPGIALGLIRVFLLDRPQLRQRLLCLP